MFVAVAAVTLDGVALVSPAIPPVIVIIKSSGTMAPELSLLLKIGFVFYTFYIELFI